MRYIDLSKPHAYLIWKGKQRAVVSPELLPVGEKMLVIQDSKEAFGEVVLAHPAQISLTEFERLEEEHSTRPAERKLKWPNQESFYLYRFKDWRPFPDARDIEIDNGSAEVLPIPELTEAEQKLLDQAEQLPKTLILKEDAVILEDGKVSFCEGLDGSKIMPILSATLEDKSVADSLPLYQLALVRIPRLKLKKNMEDNMELDDEKAEGTKPYKVVKNHPGCKEGKPYAVLNTETEEVKGCADTEEMATEHMQSMMEEDKGGPGSGRRPGGSHRTTSPNKKKPKKAGSRKELAKALVEVLVEDDEEEQLTEEGEKEQSLSAKVQEVSQAFRDQFNPKPPDMPKQMPMYHWVKEVYPDYAIVGCDMGKGNKLYKVSYSTDENGQLKFADKSKWAEMEVQLVPTGNVGAKGLMAGYDENSKSFSEWVEDYYNFADKAIGDLSEEEAIKAVWSNAFVNGLPDSSFLHIQPDCGDKDEEGKTKPRSCRMFPVKDANGQVDLPHLRNAIARAPQASTIPEDVRMKVQKKAQAMLASVNKEEDGEKAGRKVKKTMLEKVKKAWETIKEFMDWAEPGEDDEEDDMPMMGGMMSGKSAIGIKKVGNDWWYISWSTNAFEDREKEIFSTKSLEKYVAEAETKEDRGYFNLWHIPNTDFAEKKWQGVAGRFLIEAGPFLKDEKGKSALKFFKQYAEGHKELAPEGWGCSPEYRYLPEERKSKVYENIWITRTSTLPKMAAANIWTQGGITMALTKEQTKAAELIFGEELTKDIVKTAEAKTKELEEAGVAHKSVEEEQPKTEEVKPVEEVKTTEEDLVTQLAQKMAVDWEPVKALLQGLVDSQKNLESKLTALESQVSEETKVEAQKAKEESPKYVWRLFERASEAEKTVVAKDDPLYDKKPAEAPLKDKSGAAHFFGK